MRRAFQLCAQSIRLCLSWVGLFALWTLWLGLGVLLVLQLYIASANELALPDFVLRQLEEKLAESGLRATFSRTSFDPVGRILIENAALSLPAYAEPVATARAVFIQLNPLMLAIGQVEPFEVRIIGASLAVPVMLSGMGQPTEIVHDLDATLEPGNKKFTISQLSARVAGVTVSARGTVLLPRRTTAAPVNLGEALTRLFPVIARQSLKWSQQVERFDDPAVHLELAPSESGATSINITLLARAVRLDEPIAAQVTGFRASTRLLLLEDTPTTWIELSASDVRLPNDTRIRGVHANLYGRLQPNGPRFDLRELALNADAVTVPGFSASDLSAQLFPRTYPKFDVIATGNLFDAALNVQGHTDLTAGTATATFTGDLSPRVLDGLSQHLGVEVRQYFDFESLVIDQAEARFSEKWTFEKLAAKVRVQGVNAYGVRMTDGVAEVELDPDRFYSPEAFARIGENFARGSYEQNLDTLEYRFLLAGRLRPLEISPWFRDWWPNFFQQLEFPFAPPDAAVDVRGVWREGNRTSVFVQADAPRPVIRGADFARVRTRLFIRPGFVEGLEVVGFRPEGEVRGRFAYLMNPETDGLSRLELAFDSSVDLSVATRIVGPILTSVLEPFQFTGTPNLKMIGMFTGAEAAEGEHKQLRIDARTTGAFGFHRFPLRDVSFRVTVDDDNLLIENVEAIFAGGIVGGRARVTGMREQRWLGFDVQLRDARLGEAATELQSFFARQKGQSSPTPGKFVQERANVRLDFAASGEGRYDEPSSFRGAGNAMLQGAEIGEVALLGALSELLRFTTLRFNNAQANLRLESGKLVFPEVKLRGANSAIDAHGSYSIERQELDFNARILPFQESANLLKSVVGAVLSPLSNVFEVKLSGSLEKPQWALLLGPTHFLRSRAPGEPGEKDPTDDALAPATTVPGPAGEPTTSAGSAGINAEPANL